MRRVGGTAVPEYQLHLGGGIDGEGATFGRQVVKVPARRVPAAVVRLLELYRKERSEGEARWPTSGASRPRSVKKRRGRPGRVRRGDGARPEDWLDHGDDAPFKVAIGQGECAI